MKKLIVELRTAVLSTAILTAVLCGLYPLAVWGIAQTLFHDEANGSLVRRGQAVVGSSLIGQDFKGPGYFHPRPSAAGNGYDGANSGGSNLGPTSKKLLDAVAERVKAYRDGNGLPEGVWVPADAVTASGSGLDPHVSPANARLQAPRVAKERGVRTDQVLRLAEEHTEDRDLGFLGERRVNVLLLNIDLDRRYPSR